MEEELVDTLQEQEIDYEDSAVPLLIDLLNRYELSADDLCNHWLAFTTNHNDYNMLDKNAIPHFDRLELKLRVKKSIENKFNQFHTVHNNDSFNSFVKKHAPTTPGSTRRNNNNNNNKNQNSGITTSGRARYTQQSSKKINKSQSRVKRFTRMNDNNNNNSNENDNNANHFDFEMNDSGNNTSNVKNKSNDNNGDSLSKYWNANLVTPAKSSKKQSIRSRLTTPMSANKGLNSIHASPAPMANGVGQSPAYLERKNRGQTVASINGHLPLLKLKNLDKSLQRSHFIHIDAICDYTSNKNNHNNDMISTITDCRLETNNFDNLRRYRFMCEDVYIKKECLKNRLIYLGKHLSKQIIMSNNNNNSGKNNDKNNKSNDSGTNNNNNNNNINSGSNTNSSSLLMMDEKDKEDDTMLNSPSNDLNVMSGNNGNNNGENKENGIDFADIDEPSQIYCYYLGRIMNDGDNSSAIDKLTNGSLVIESIESGKHVKLDISQIEGNYGLFPGQCAIVYGMNPSGKEIIVKNIFTDASLPKYRDLEQLTIMNDFFEAGTSMGNGGNNNNNNNNMNDEMQDIDIDLSMNNVKTDKDVPMQVIMAAGPFLPKMTLSFEGSPLMDLARQICRRHIDVAILMGPFVDIHNEVISSNKATMTFQEIFESLLFDFINYLEKQGSDCRLCIVPSTKDVHHLTAFPQPRYSIENMNLCQNEYFQTYVQLYTNPCHICINGMSFGISNVDYLLNSVTLGIHGGTENDRLAILSGHCIEQQSFYPLEPCEVSIRKDFTHEKHLLMRRTPDILVLPSQLKYFVKKITNKNVICVNPSFLTKSNTGGTYCLLTVHKPNKDMDFSKCVRADIVKI